MKKNVQNSAVKTAIFMAVLTFTSKIFGLLREVVLANYFGTGYVVDAYVMATTILSVLFGGIIVAISTSYMPVFSRVIEEEGDIVGDKFTSQVINYIIIIAFTISIMGFCFSDEIVKIFASGFQGETANLTSFFVKIIFSYIVFYSISSILEAYLQYNGMFLPQIISGYCISFCIIIAIIFSSYTSYYYLAFGILIGHLFRSIIILYIAKKKGFNYYKKLNLTSKTKDVINLAFPVFIGSYISYINMFIDKTLASRLAEGSISALNYASLINNMIIGVTITVLSTLIYPKLSQANSLGNNERFNSLVEVGMNFIVCIAVPCSLGAMVYSKEIIQIIYERGAFGQVATAMTSSAFTFYATGLIFMSLNVYITKIYYAMHDMKAPMIFGAVSVVINIILNVILVQFMKHNGLALSTSIAAMCNTLLLGKGMKYLHKDISLITSRKKILKIVFSSIISVLVSFFIYNILIQYFLNTLYIRVIQFAISVIIAAFIYFLLLKLYRIEEVKTLFAFFKQIRKK